MAAKVAVDKLEARLATKVAQDKLEARLATKVTQDKLEARPADAAAKVATAAPRRRYRSSLNPYRRADY